MMKIITALSRFNRFKSLTKSKCTTQTFSSFISLANLHLAMSGSFHFPLLTYHPFWVSILNFPSLAMSLSGTIGQERLKS